MRKYVELFISHLPHGRALGIELVSSDDSGRVVVRQPWHEDLVGNPETGVLHGGVITALLDTLGAACAIARGGYVQATLDLRIDYLRPATPRVALIAEAECYRTTRHIAFVRGTCHQGDPSRAVANLTATFVLREPKSTKQAKSADVADSALAVDSTPAIEPASEADSAQLADSSRKVKS